MYIDVWLSGFLLKQAKNKAWQKGPRRRRSTSQNPFLTVHPRWYFAASSRDRFQRGRRTRRERRSGKRRRKRRMKRRRRIKRIRNRRRRGRGRGRRRRRRRRRRGTRRRGSI